MKILVVGLGSIGRRHIKNLRAINPSIQIAVCHEGSEGDRLEDLSSQIDQVVYGLDQALPWQPDAALITNPASMHIEKALALGELGVDLFIEKPLSNTLNHVDELLDLCKKRSLILMVGYNFRFYRPLQLMQQAVAKGEIGRVVGVRAEVGQFLPEWRPGDYRQQVSAQQITGGGAVLELSHELDYVRWLVGEIRMVIAQIDHLSDLEIDVEDTAEVILRFDNGAIGSVHLDMIQRPPTRSCRVIGTEGVITWDWSSHRVQLFSARSNSWVDLHPARAFDRNEMYVAEIRHFLDCVAGKGVPIVNGNVGKRVLEIALAAKKSAEDGRVVTV
jgi:predicted dehydrogenase